MSNEGIKSEQHTQSKWIQLNTVAPILYWPHVLSLPHTVRGLAFTQGDVQGLIQAPWIKLATYRCREGDECGWWLESCCLGLSVGPDCVCVSGQVAVMGRRGMEGICHVGFWSFKRAFSHFLWANLGDVYYYSGDEQSAPTHLTTLSPAGLMCCRHRRLVSFLQRHTLWLSQCHLSCIQTPVRPGELD